MNQIKNLYQNESNTLNDAFERIVAEIHIRKEGENLKSFMLVGCEPSSGTTTISINVAISMAKSGWKTLLVDGDMRKGVTNKRLNEDGEKGLSDYLTGKAKLEEVTSKTNNENLDYIGSGCTEASVIGMFCSSNATKFMDEIKNKYDYIIFDMPSMASAFDASVMAAQFDSIILVTKQGEGKKKYIKEAKNKLENAGGHIFGIIVNKVEGNEYRRALKNFDYFNKHRFFVKAEKARKADK